MTAASEATAAARAAAVARADAIKCGKVAEDAVARARVERVEAVLSQLSNDENAHPGNSAARSAKTDRIIFKIY